VVGLALDCSQALILDAAGCKLVAAGKRLRPCSMMRATPLAVTPRCPPAPSLTCSIWPV